jgi:hypothetical protein
LYKTASRLFSFSSCCRLLFLCFPRQS